jgi:3-hydroxy-3-methylglutaryl CoA synthase
MTLRKYDKKMMSLRLGLKYWQLVVNNNHEWDRKDPVLDPRGLQAYVNELKQTVDHYAPDEQEELKKTDRIAISTMFKEMDQKLRHTLIKKQHKKLGLHWEKGHQYNEIDRIGGKVL